MKEPSSARSVTPLYAQAVVMDADADTHHPERAVFENKNGGPISGFTGKPPVKPRNAPNAGWKSISRSLTHIPLNP